MINTCKLRSDIMEVAREENTWEKEARLVIDEVRNCVKEIEVASQKNLYPDKLIYLNLTTLEDDKYSVELGEMGFRIIGRGYNCKILMYVNKTSKYFATIYALLEHVSRKYRASFREELLSLLNKERTSSSVN